MDYWGIDLHVRAVLLLQDDDGYEGVPRHILSRFFYQHPRDVRFYVVCPVLLWVVCLLHRDGSSRADTVEEDNAVPASGQDRQGGPEPLDRLFHKL